MSQDHVNDSQIEAARRWARAAAGDDDAAYLQLLTAALNATDWVVTARDDERNAVAGVVLKKMSGLPGARPTRSIAAAVPSIYVDPAFLDNQMTVDLSNTRIIGGIPTPDYPDCVAVGNLDTFCCTGTLIAPSAVLTAGHCAAGGCAQRVFVGGDVKAEGTTITVREVITHPDYVPDSNTRPYDDLAVLLLERPVDDVEPRRIASLDAIADAQTTRLVGYGTTDVYGRTGYGQRRRVDVGIAGKDPDYGARVDTEFVAGMPNLDMDSCRGDSGGPAYIEVDGTWQLAGAVSRATGVWRPPRVCGDGGVYTKVAAYLDWLHELAGPLV